MGKRVKKAKKERKERRVIRVKRERSLISHKMAMAQRREKRVTAKVRRKAKESHHRKARKREIVAKESPIKRERKRVKKVVLAKVRKGKSRANQNLEVIRINHLTMEKVVAVRVLRRVINRSRVVKSRVKKLPETKKATKHRMAKVILSLVTRNLKNYRRPSKL